MIYACSDQPTNPAVLRMTGVLGLAVQLLVVGRIPKETSSEVIPHLTLVHPCQYWFGSVHSLHQPMHTLVIVIAESVLSPALSLMQANGCFNLDQPSPLHTPPPYTPMGTAAGNIGKHWNEGLKWAC